MTLAVSPTRPSSPSLPRPATDSHPQAGMLMALLFIAIFTPIYVEIAGLRLDPVRIYLMVLFIPFAVRLFSGRAGRLIWADYFMLGFNFWMILTLLYHHGMERFGYAAILGVETFGGYMTGRILIRSSLDYRRFIHFYLIALLVALPLAIYELNYDQMPLRTLFKGIFPVVNKNHEIRYGLSRVQVAFPHSILYGLFCSLAISSIYYLYRGSVARVLPRLALAIGMTLMSLSSAPMISAAMQLLIITWGRLTGERWKLLAGLVVFIYFALNLLSNRGAVILFIETFTLNPQTGWWRVFIWKYGSASVMNHPIFGIGLNSWERPNWLASTVDNFWLLMAMRHGLPGFGSLALAVGLHIFAILRMRDLNPEDTLVRKAYMVTLAGLVFTLATVHVWSTMNVMTMLFIGAGVFIYTGVPQDRNESPETMDPAAPQGRSGLPLSRFPRSAPAARPLSPPPVRSRNTPRPYPPKATSK